jgi:hypothetical protein
MFLGQFLSPLAVLALKNLTGTLRGAVLAYATACCIAALIAGATLFEKNQRSCTRVPESLLAPESWRTRLGSCTQGHA